MAKRGRRSADETAIAALRREATEATVESAPDAPYDLNDDEADVWRSVVATKHAHYFGPETQPLLAQYCRHVVGARTCANMVRTLEDMVRREAKLEKPAERGATVMSAAKELDRLFKMRDRESRAMSSLAVKLRLTQSATYDREKKLPAARRRPWQLDKPLGASGSDGSAG